MGLTRVVAYLVFLSLSLGAFGAERVGTSCSFAIRSLVWGLRRFVSFDFL